jgi:hypothetical protein
MALEITDRLYLRREFHGQCSDSFRIRLILDVI